MDKKMKKCLFVTIADENYLEQAKQLFSSAYWNAGWKGDYMLLAHEVPEKKLKWFKDKGILIKKCKALHKKDPNSIFSIFMTKFYLFTKEFKKWDTIVYSDADVIVRANFDALCSLKGFWSVRDLSRTIGRHIINEEERIKRGLDEAAKRKLVMQLASDCNLDHPAFAPGFFVFDTDSIKEDTFNRLKRTFEKYYVISAFGDPIAFNLIFYNWKELPPAYNIFLMNESNQWFIPPNKINGIMLHFPSKDKPWVTKNYFYQEWKNNLDRADLIDLKNRPAGKIWSNRQIHNYTRYLERGRRLNEPYFVLDRYIGLIGIKMKKLSPRLYNLFKKWGRLKIALYLYLIPFYNLLCFPFLFYCPIGHQNNPMTVFFNHP